MNCGEHAGICLGTTWEKGLLDGVYGVPETKTILIYACIVGESW